MSANGAGLPKAPRELCFTELVFIQETFDVDAFLQDHRKSTKLENMRDDLGIYLKLLRSAMIDLINKDYADFVNLSSNLIGLDKAIGDLQAPLGQLKEQVMQVRQTLDDEISMISGYLNDNRKIREYRQSLHSLQYVYKLLKKLSSLLSAENITDNSVKIDSIEQAATEFNQLKFHLSRCKLDISSEKEKESNKLEEKYLDNLNQFFLMCINEKDTALLIRCLRIYVTLDKVSDAEDIVKTAIVSPLIDSIISEENLQVNPLGLENIYNRFLSILNVELKQLLDITLDADRTCVKGFNFLVNSFWVEVEEKIEEHVKCIFAPGDPILFHRRYVATLNFLEKLEQECITDTSLITLINHPQYKGFLKKWNLPVYFQIRFQEIAGGVETILMESVSPASIKGPLNSLLQDDFSLHATCVIWDSLSRVWADDVFLRQLFHRFWKLTLQICSRYQTWSRATLKQVWPVISETNSTAETEQSRLSFLVYLHVDIEKLIKTLPCFLKTAQNKVNSDNPAHIKALEDSFEDTIANFQNLLPSIAEEIVNELLKQCLTHLKQVSDIPRLFRRTKRDVPTKACVYVKNIVTPLAGFYSDYNKIIPTNISRWIESALTLLTEHYLMSVTDVLTSVQKTEESLRRLKKIRDKSTGTLPSEAQGVSDDEKIRIQLQVDVRAYTEMINDFGVSSSNIHHLEDLTEAVEAAVKK